VDGVIGGTATGSESLKNLVVDVYARGCTTVVIVRYRLFSANEHVDRLDRACAERCNTETGIKAS
jgi:hypothetical protein